MACLALASACATSGEPARQTSESASADSSPTESSPTESAPAGSDSDQSAQRDPAPDDAGSDGLSARKSAFAKNVGDGDSFTVVWADGSAGEIRMVGLNAPEFGACHSAESRAALTTLLGNAPLTVDDLGTDRFGRTLATVYVNGESVNLAMVSDGHALASSSDVASRDRYQQAQARARSDGAGMWSADACIDEGSPLRFGEFQADPPGADNRVLTDEWITVANISAEPVDLSGWALRDESTGNRFEFPDNRVLPAGSSVRVRTGAGTDSPNDLYWNERFPVWNNDGDTALLVTPDGRFGDVVSHVPTR